MMSEMGLAELKLHDGSHLKVSTTYRAHISEANKEWRITGFVTMD
jgi:hypothetical protein